MRKALILLLTVVSLTGCKSTDMTHHVERAALVKELYCFDPVSVELENPSKKYARFEEKMRQELDANIGYDCMGGQEQRSLDIVVSTIHITHKGLSYVTGGAAGGNWMYANVTMRDAAGKDLKTREINTSFNTGGGYTIFQDWEAKMIRYFIADLNNFILDKDTVITDTAEDEQAD